MRAKAQAHAANPGHQLILIFHARELDFVADSPRQSRRLVSQCSVPPQWRMQIDSTSCDETQDMVGRSRLLRHASTDQAETHPREKRSSRGQSQTANYR